MYFRKLHIKESIELNDEELELLYDIADRYNSSTPVSGNWDTETKHEQKAIAWELDVSLDDAKTLMIDVLGFDETQFN